MVLACWSCHNKIHHFGWRIHGPPGNRTLHPPEAVTYGPAHAPERPRLFRSGTPDSPDPPDQPRLLEPVAAQSSNKLAPRRSKATCAPDHTKANGSRQSEARC